MPGPQTQYLQLQDGAKLAYAILGKEHNVRKTTPILMVMGLGGVKEDWTHLSQALSRTRQVCIVDNRGMGESLLPARSKKTDGQLPPFLDGSDLTILQLATDIFDLLLHLKWHEFHLLGMSMGGMIAQQLILLLRGRDDFNPTSLILIATTPRSPRSPLAGLLTSIQSDATTLKSTSGTGAIPPEKKKEIARMITEYNLTAEFCRQNPRKLEQLVEANISKRRPMETIAAQMLATYGFNVVDQLHLVYVPTLVVHGLGDRIIDPR
ncbi:hypothetical protein HK102_006776 [Quaeritorhiza haematococci]|nr:hypothetical protein HK102_006776 [Quaeritorhiza haematococci]